MIEKPVAGEYPPYMEKYLNQLPENEPNVLDLLQKQIGEMEHLLEAVSEEQAEKPYAEGKWSLKELISHIIDTERILAYRALCIARGDKQPLPSFEEDDYARNSFANNRALKDLLEEYKLVRLANLSMFRSFNPTVFKNLGNANGNPASVRALAWIIAAHEEHHKNIIQNRYLVKLMEV